MFTKINNTIAKAAVIAMDVKRNPVVALQKLERGDADSGGSTLRTLGVVILIVAVVLLVGAAVMRAANQAGTRIDEASFPW